MTTGQFLLTGWTWGGASLPLGAGALACYLAKFGLNRRFAYFAAALGLARELRREGLTWRPGVR